MENVNKSIEVETSEGLTFKELLFIVKKHLLAIIAIVVVLTGVGFVYSKVQAPEYKSSSTVYVGYEDKNNNISNEYNFSKYITETYVEFFSEGVVINKTVENLKAKNIDISAAKLRGGLSVGIKGESLILVISYVDTDAKQAKQVLETYIDTAIEIADSVDKEDKAVYKMLKDNLSVMTPANDGAPVSHTMKNLVVFFAVGLVAAFLYVLIRELLNNKFKSSEEIERALGLPVLAGIPEYMFDDEKKAGK